MKTRNSLWQRIGSVLRFDGHRRMNEGGATAVRTDTSGKFPDDSQLSADHPAALDRHRPTSRLSWWSQRQQRAALQRRNLERVGELMNTVQAHFAAQDDRGRQLVESLQTLGRALEQSAEMQRMQGESLRAIAEQVQLSGKHTAVLSDSLSRLPASLQAQSEAIRAVSKRLETAQETDAQLTEALQTFGRAIDGLNTTSGAQVRTLERLHADQAEQRQSLTTLVREQNRRVWIGLLVAAGLAVAAFASVALVAWLQLNRSAAG